jgi:O-antigen/teichoic acid export membrane protein
MRDDGDGTALGSRAASGVAWLTAQTWAAKIGGFVTLVILARILGPDDFGIVAVAMTVVSLVSLVADLGFGTYLMQVSAVTPRLASTAFWYSLGSGIALAGLLVVTAPLVEAIFGIAGVTVAMVGISPAVLFVSVAAVPIALLRRSLRFRVLAMQSVAAALIAQAVAIALAVTGFGVWALVAQVVLAQALTMAASWVTARWRPALLFSARDFVTMLRFGSSVVSINLIAAARVWAENALISNVLGAAALGRMSVAQRLVQTTQEVAGAAIAPVSTVVFAHVRDDPDRLRRGYDRALSLAYVVITPALTVILVTAPVLVPFLFGTQWAPAAGIASALAAAAIFTVTATLDHGLFLGAGRPGRWLAYAVVIDALTLATTAVLVWHGVLAVAGGFVAVAAVATGIRSVLVARLLGAPLWSVLRRTCAALSSMAISAACGWLVLLALSAWEPVAALIVVGVVVVAVHLVVARLVLPGALRDLTVEVRTRIRRG